MPQAPPSSPGLVPGILTWPPQLHAWLQTRHQNFYLVSEEEWLNGSVLAQLMATVMTTTLALASQPEC